MVFICAFLMIDGGECCLLFEVSWSGLVVGLVLFTF